MEHMTPEWLSIREATRQLKVGRTTLYRWLKEGRLRAYRIGPKAVRIRRADLERVVTPLPHAGEEVSRMKEQESAPTPVQLQTAIRPLTAEEIQRGLAALQRSQEITARMRAERGGQPFDESWPLIRAAREERDQRL